MNKPLFRSSKLGYFVVIFSPKKSWTWQIQRLENLSPFFQGSHWSIPPFNRLDSTGAVFVNMFLSEKCWPTKVCTKVTLSSNFLDHRFAVMLLAESFSDRIWSLFNIKDPFLSINLLNLYQVGWHLQGKSISGHLHAVIIQKSWDIVWTGWTSTLPGESNFDFHVQRVWWNMAFKCSPFHCEASSNASSSEFSTVRSGEFWDASADKES